MDESQQEKIALNALEIKQWFRKTHDDLLKQETELESAIFHAKFPNAEPYMSIRTIADLIAASIHNIGAAFDAIGSIIEGEDAIWDEITNANERALRLRNEFTTYKNSTEVALNAINAFVEQYTPILKEVEESKRFKANAQSGNHIWQIALRKQ